MCKENGRGVMTTPERELEGDDDLHERAMRWPEDPVDGISWLHKIYNIYDRWTFSYMSAVLTKGKNQKLKDGTHLTQDDLYRVPDAMRSNILSEKFR
jgi:hypothetical protein